jgi:hypothetical protein
MRQDGFHNPAGNTVIRIFAQNGPRRLIEVAQKRGLKIKRLNPDGSVDIGEPEAKDEKGKGEIIL